jgi:hypothetical protein
MANVNTVDVLKNEARQIEKQIGHLTEQHKVLNQTISFFTHRSGFGVHKNSAPQAATKKKSVTRKKTTSTKRKGMSSTKTGHSTMDMIRTVLENHGQPLSAQDIRARVKETFGVEPSKSYAQMLYKRAKAGAGFFKSQKLYGVIPKSQRSEAAAA